MIDHRPMLRARAAAVSAAVAFFVGVPAESAPLPTYPDLAPRPQPRAAAAPVVLADEPPAPLRRITPRGGTPDPAGPESRLPSAGSVISSLAVVVVLVFGAARLWKAHGPRLAAAAPAEAAEVLGRCRIEARQSLYLVRLGSRVLVLGSSNGELAALSEVTDPAEVDLIVAQCRSGGGGASPFTRLFEARQRAERPGDRPSPEAAETRTAAPSRWSRATPEQRLAERVRGRATDEEPARVA